MNQYKKTLVLDISYIPRSVIPCERAFVVSYKGNAEIIHRHPVSFKLVNPELDIGKPSIIRVPSFIKAPYNKVPLSKENIFRRDNYECVYCGDERKSKLTLDHVIPKSQGGTDTWENLVTSCRKCNNKKSDLSLEEFGKEIPQPRRPHYLMLIHNLKYLPDEWNPYLFLD